MNWLKNAVLKVLKWLEGHTKTDMTYLAKGGFWLLLGQFVATGSAFLASVAFANLLAPEIFGVYKFILSINSLVLISTLSGMDSAITQSVARGFDGTLNVGVRTKIKWGALGTLTSFGIALYYFMQGNMLLAISFSVAAVFVPFTESFDMYDSFLAGKQLFGVQTRYNIIKKCIALVSIIAVIYLTKNLYLIILTYFVSITLPNIFFLHRTKKVYVDNDNVDPEAIKYGKNLSGIYIMTLIMGELDKILVFHYVGAADLAIYALATAPTDQIKGLMKNINSLAFPKFANKTGEEIKKTIWAKVKILGLVTGVIVFIYILLAPLFFNMFFPKYLASIRYSQVLALSLIPVIIAGFIATILESQKDRVGVYKYNLYGNVIGIIILLPFIYIWGLWGAVIARLINRLVFLSVGAKIISRKN
ncbi:MAG TPA: oligosaccharide flippase family protein [Candidatus Paceibacterota bacterium]